MVQSLSPEEAQSLIREGNVDVIDVREPSEFATGHIPRARNVALGELKSDAKGKLSPGKILFVCARGMRSQTAANVAESAGFTEVYHVDGGTQAWWAEGLPVETPARDDASTRSVSSSQTSSRDPSCGLPEPGLDVVVGANLRELRAQRNMSLDELARRTGLSRTLLGQIELGKTPPSVSGVWRIAQAFNVHFSALLATAERVETSVLRAADAKRLIGPDGRFSSRALYPFNEKPDAEFYELYLAPHSREDAEAHQPGTRENLVVTAGRLDLYVGNERFELAKSDAIVFTADVPHSYVNPGGEECWMYLVMTYAGAPSRGSS